MSNGASYAIVPFVNKRASARSRESWAPAETSAPDAVGFLFKTTSIAWPQALLILGVLVFVSSSLAFLVRFSERDEASARAEMEARPDPTLLPAAAGAGGLR